MSTGFWIILQLLKEVLFSRSQNITPKKFHGCLGSRVPPFSIWIFLTCIKELDSLSQGSYIYKRKRKRKRKRVTDTKNKRPNEAMFWNMVWLLLITIIARFCRRRSSPTSDKSECGLPRQKWGKRRKDGEKERKSTSSSADLSNRSVVDRHQFHFSSRGQKVYTVEYCI